MNIQFLLVMTIWFELLFVVDKISKHLEREKKKTYVH